MRNLDRGQAYVLRAVLLKPDGTWDYGFDCGCGTLLSEMEKANLGEGQS